MAYVNIIWIPTQVCEHDQERQGLRNVEVLDETHIHHPSSFHY